MDKSKEDKTKKSASSKPKTTSQESGEKSQASKPSETVSGDGARVEQCGGSTPVQMDDNSSLFL